MNRYIISYDKNKKNYSDEKFRREFIIFLLVEEIVKTASSLKSCTESCILFNSEKSPNQILKSMSKEPFYEKIYFNLVQVAKTNDKFLSYKKPDETHEKKFNKLIKKLVELHANS